MEIKEGKKPSTPITVIFCAKAAPAHVIAKDIIHLILCLQEVISNDSEVSPHLKVFMLMKKRCIVMLAMVLCKGAGKVLCSVNGGCE